MSEVIRLDLIFEDAKKEAYKVGQRDTINKVLEIIDKRIEHNNPVSTLLQARAVSELNHVKHDILALQGGKSE